MAPPIYLDYQSTTPLDQRVLKAMMPYLATHFGNPHSATHAYGWTAEAALDLAREEVAAVIAAKPREIVFTSGATEANNLAIKGVMQALGAKRPKLVTVVTEHKCVLQSAAACLRDGYEVEMLPVGSDGLVDPDRLSAVVDERTALVSVMAVNNEIGVVQPLAEIGRIARAAGALFHTDAAQAFGKIPLNAEAMNIDLMSISGHKIYGPKGVGALYRRDERRVAVRPQMDGGGQEGGLRSGTQPPALVAGLGRAARLSSDGMSQEAGHLKTLMDRLKTRLRADIPDMLLNGHETTRWPGNLNVSFPGLDGDLLLAELRGLALSSGAACASAVEGPSYVLEAIGRGEAETRAALRIGIGRFTTDQDIDTAGNDIVQAVQKLKGLCS